MLRFFIPACAAIVGAMVLWGAGAFENQQGSSGAAFLTLLHASHAAAMAERSGGGGR